MFRDKDVKAFLSEILAPLPILTPPSQVLTMVLFRPLCRHIQFAFHSPFHIAKLHTRISILLWCNNFSVLKTNTAPSIDVMQLRDKTAPVSYHQETLTSQESKLNVSELLHTIQPRTSYLPRQIPSPKWSRRLYTYCPERPRQA